MLVLGEVDCRFHIYYQAKKRNESILFIILETIRNYGLALEWLQCQGVNPIVLGNPPAGTYDRFEHDTPGKPYASPETLSVIYREFNKQMKSFCKSVEIIYLDIYSKTADENGFLKKEFAADAVHLNLKALPIIKEMLTQQITHPEYFFEG
jgi:hypothetical protein